MKIISETEIINKGNFSDTLEWDVTRNEIREAIRSISWPPGSPGFTINPMRKGNGVKPIKSSCMELLANNFGWSLERTIFLQRAGSPGKVDALQQTSYGPLALEWETGNISSTHRALNKMSLGLIQNLIVGGVLILPTRRFYRYLTDRIGNFEEIQPYFPMWRALDINQGILMIIAIEHDFENVNVPRITKGTDGRALR